MPRGYASPYSGTSTPGPDYAYNMYSSPTPTPSPRHYPEYGPPPHMRPATRASHTRSGSAAYEPTFRPPTASPRYRSTGEYATINVSNSGRQFKVYYTTDYWGTDGRYYYAQGGGPYYSAPSYSFRDAAYETTSSRRASGKHSRRASMSTPKDHRTSTPSSSPKMKKPLATEEDRKRWKIPKGFSMKNWDPTEQPILLLGSVFDANSVGKWIYDWTANVHGAATPLADEAGELWLLLIQLYGKVARMEKVVNRVRNRDDKELIQEFLASGDRLTAKFQEILKSCEQPMLDASKDGSSSSLGASAGVEFVGTLFGRDRKLKDIEKFMQYVRTFNLRFDVNCEAIIRNPTK